MVKRVSELFGYTVRAADGDVGKLDDLYLDDKSWVDLAKPVSEQERAQLLEYWGWSSELADIPVVQSLPVGEAHVARQQHLADPESVRSNLRSVREMIGYRIRARGGEFGRVEDFCLTTEDWMIRYMWRIRFWFRLLCGPRRLFRHCWSSLHWLPVAASAGSWGYWWPFRWRPGCGCLRYWWSRRPCGVRWGSPSLRARMATIVKRTRRNSRFGAETRFDLMTMRGMDDEKDDPRC